MAVKKSARGVNLPGVHPGLEQKLREAEKAELEGRTPRKLDEGPQKITRPALDTSEKVKDGHVRAIGLVETAEKIGVDGRLPLADQAGFMPGVDLDQVWDELSENQKIRAGSIERFRLEMETNLLRTAMPWERPHEIGGRLDARALKRSQQNIYAEIEAFAYVLAEDSLHLLERFVDETRALLVLCVQEKFIQGIDAATMYEIQSDWVHKLIYQELVSRRRAMGDRGIRRICANIELAERVYESMLGKVETHDPRDRLVMRMIHVHQDIGHTAYAARVSFRGTRMHRAYGARIFTDELNAFRALFHHKEIELIRTAIATHSSEELPFDQSRVLALVRAIDHLAPFAPHRVYEHLREIETAHPILDRMLATVVGKRVDVDGYVEARAALRDHLEELELPPPLRDDIIAGLRAVERKADPIDLGELAGNIVKLKYDMRENPGSLTATIEADDFVQKYQVLFDYQQDQILRVARNVDVPLKDLKTSRSLELRAEGSGALIIDRGAAEFSLSM